MKKQDSVMSLEAEVKKVAAKNSPENSPKPDKLNFLSYESTKHLSEQAQKEISSQILVIQKMMKEMIAPESPEIKREGHHVF